MTDANQPQVRQLRLCVTAPDYDEALRFYRDVLGLPEQATYAANGGRVTILEAGVATLSWPTRPTPSTSTRSRSGGGWPDPSGSPSRSATPPP